jgi:hypothetical protein
MIPTHFFHAWMGPMWVPKEVHRVILLRTYIFASSAICWLHSVLCYVQDVKYRSTIFHDRMALVWVPQEARWEMLC